jgi:hypothetical protein
MQLAALLFEKTTERRSRRQTKWTPQGTLHEKGPVTRWAICFVLPMARTT